MTICIITSLKTKHLQEKEKQKNERGRVRRVICHLCETL